MVAQDVKRSRSRSRSPPATPTSKREALLQKKSKVQFFHVADPARKHALYVCPTRTAGRGPRLLQSHGWLEGSLEEDYCPRKFDASNRDTWPLILPSSDLLFAERSGAKPGVPCVEGKRVHPDYMRKPRAQAPLLSLVFVRWGGEDAVWGPNDSGEQNDGDWGAFGSPACDEYMSCLVSEAMMKHPRLVGEEPGFNFEVYSLFARNSLDVALMPSLAPWIEACLKGVKRTSFWMMWPSEWEDCRGADYAAYIERHTFFGGMRAFEAAGIRTGFPHPADQYEQIVSKAWMATLSLQPQARLPAGTMVSKGIALSNPKAAAQQALATLEYIRSQNPFPIESGELPGPSAVNRDGIKKGVVKLGWSWEARYVVIFRDEDDLAIKMTELLATPGCLASTCIVQEWVDFDFEMRLYFLPPVDWIPTQKLKPTRVECNAWSGSMDNGQRRNFHKLSREDVLEKYWEQDDEAFKSAKKQAVNISQYLIGWLTLNEAQPVPMIRMDFMLLRLGPGKVRVVFGEYCEMGACCLGWKEGPPTIWRAALDSVLK